MPAVSAPLATTPPLYHIWDEHGSRSWELLGQGGSPFRGPWTLADVQGLFSAWHDATIAVVADRDKI